MYNIAKGYLVVGVPISINGISYFGVNTDAWPIGIDFDSEIAVDICEYSYLDLSFPLLVDFDTAMHYCCLCQRIGIRTRVLYCEALINHSVQNYPQFEQHHGTTCLGFDYAYPSGDYYSAVVNDIICRDNLFPTLWKNHLNQFGLLSSVDELMQFAEERAFSEKEYLRHGQEMLLEKGNFVGFHVFSVDLSKDFLLE